VDAPGDFGLPIKYGYSLVGHAADGALVHCLHPHQSTAYALAEDLYILPAGIDPKRAALLSNMEAVLNAIWDAGTDLPASVMICGFGNIGALLANTLRLHANIDAIIIETEQWRRKQARSMDFECCAPENNLDSSSVIFHTSGTQDGLQFCLDSVAVDGTVVELSWYGTKAVSLQLGGNFHWNRVRLLSTQVSSIPPSVRAKIDYKKRNDIAAELLSDNSYDALITQLIPFDESPSFFDGLRSAVPNDGLIWLIEY
jgi:threonine dehydrogenase-like Zn-dependent dehydrogenase